MEIINKNNISYQEMDELIGLAEKVSVNIEHTKDKIKIKYFYVAMYLLVISLVLVLKFSGIIEHFFIKNSTMSSVIAALIGVILGSIFVQIIFKFIQINDNQLIINREQKVLQKLLNMIEGYKDLYVEDEYGNNSRVLSKALFEMRLSRINFGVK